MASLDAKSKSRRNSGEVIHSGEADTNGIAANGKAPPPDKDNAAPPVAPSRLTADDDKVDERPVICITTEEHEVTAQAAAALARTTDIYQRGGELVRVLTDQSPSVSGIERPRAAHIAPLPQPQLRSILTKHIRFVKVKPRGEDGSPVFEKVPIHPPPWCVADVHTRQSWEGVPPLRSVVDYPIILDDGRILHQLGFDHVSCVYQTYNGATLRVPEKITQAVAKDACLELLEAVVDFPFKSTPHKSAWLAGLLSPFGRFAYDGPTPLFFADANVRGAGKSLLMSIISLIVTGQTFPVAVYTNDEAEMRKIITSVASDGDRAILFDNVSGAFGNKVLDGALTTTAWKDRPMRKNTMPPLPLWTIWYATGNNATLAADIGRRMCYMRLESANEHPEERKDFKIKEIEKWIKKRRTRLITAALTILRGYQQAGRPDQGLKAWGSFSGWSDFIRSAIVWAGLDDPGLTRQEVRELADDANANLKRFVKGWYQIPDQRRGLTTKQIIAEATGDLGVNAPEYRLIMNSALESLMDKIDAGRLGMLLRYHKRQMLDGLYVDKVGTTHSAVRWVVFPAEEFLAQKPDPPQNTQAPHYPNLTGEARDSGEGASIEPNFFREPGEEG